jgi:hypothetical protein
VKIACGIVALGIETRSEITQKSEIGYHEARHTILAKTTTIIQQAIATIFPKETAKKVHSQLQK